MQKRFSILVTVINLLICLLICVTLLVETKSIKAQDPQAFLGPIYYGSTTVNTVFDHDRPLLDLGLNDNDGNDWVVHYDSVDQITDPPFGLGYDEHNGIDYGLNYMPILAAADGTVAEAGWTNPQNHKTVWDCVLK